MGDKKRIVWFVLAIITMAVIFNFSGQPGDKSNEVGNTIARTMNIGPTNEWVDESHTELLFGLNLRKWAHIVLFGVLGICIYGWLLSTTKAVLICLVYAISDEVHQYFIQGREARMGDVFIDAAGFLLAIMMFYVFDKIYKIFVRDRNERWWTGSN